MNYFVSINKNLNFKILKVEIEFKIYIYIKIFKILFTYLTITKMFFNRSFIYKNSNNKKKANSI